jgi:hypothetical protein
MVFLSFGHCYLPRRWRIGLRPRGFKSSRLSRHAIQEVPTVSELNGLDPAFTVHDTPESLVLAGFKAEVFEALRGLPESLCLP